MYHAGFSNSYAGGTTGRDDNQCSVSTAVDFVETYVSLNDRGYDRVVITIHWGQEKNERISISSPPNRPDPIRDSPHPDITLDQLILLG